MLAFRQVRQQNQVKMCKIGIFPIAKSNNILNFASP